MLKYDYQDEQILKVTGGELPFECFVNLVILSGFVLAPALLFFLYFKREVAEPSPITGYDFLLYCIVSIIIFCILDQFLKSIYRSVIFINRDGRITVKIRGWNFILHTDTFEKGTDKSMELTEKKILLFLFPSSPCVPGTL
jgi:hypothetical protein